MTRALALVGYGKMGRLIEQLAPEYDHCAQLRFSSANNPGGAGLTRDALRSVAVAMEFTTPHAAPANLIRLAEAGVNTVVGTTGWLQQLPAVRDAVKQNGTALVWAANFSVGVNLFIQTVARAAALFAQQREYEAWGWEIHHAAKKDSPSGTLLKIAEEMHANGYSRDVPLSSNRAGMHPGTHEIGFDCGADTITLRHTARNREGFARGALRAARWLKGKQGVFEFREILSELDDAGLSSPVQTSAIR
jgi:4-hydroxy-tetrahydrodipicolinate reductase